MIILTMNIRIFLKWFFRKCEEEQKKMRVVLVTGELVSLAGRREDEKGDLGVAEDGELKGLLEKTILPL